MPITVQLLSGDIYTIVFEQCKTVNDIRKAILPLGWKRVVLLTNTGESLLLSMLADHQHLFAFIQDPMQEDVKKISHYFDTNQFRCSIVYPYRYNQRNRIATEFIRATILYDNGFLYSPSWTDNEFIDSREMFQDLQDTIFRNSGIMITEETVINLTHLLEIEIA